MSSLQDRYGRTMAARLDYAFKHYRHPEGREYKPKEVADAIRSPNADRTIRNLRNGENENPTKDFIRGLSVFFRVHPNFWFPELDDDDLYPAPPTRYFNE